MYRRPARGHDARAAERCDSVAGAEAVAPCPLWPTPTRTPSGAGAPRLSPCGRILSPSLALCRRARAGPGWEKRIATIPATEGNAGAGLGEPGASQAQHGGAVGASAGRSLGQLAPQEW